MISRGQAGAVFATSAWLFSCLVVGPVRADELGRVDIGKPAPDFTAQGMDGKPHRLSDYRGKPVVLEWTSPVCPYTSMKYASGAMQALQRQARSAGAVWLSVDTAAPGRLGYLDQAAMRARVKKVHAVVTQLLSDPDGRIGRAYGAKSTPQFFVIGADGRVAYQGAMDDGPESDDRKGPNYVREALSALSAHRPIKVTETKPYGCPVEY